MAVRIRLRLRSRISGEVAEVSALVNTGFETETPQLLIPVRLARLLSLYPPPPTSSVVEIGTAGGPSRVFLVRDAVDVWAVTEDREVGPKLADVLVSPIEEEVLVNDKLTEELGVVLLAPGSGRWRFADDPADRVRGSEKPQYW
jgi:hypothetical protein|uniref:Uncharacterized protein n=1 Tax=Thermofilum pendens TaxID=2269 RepID=A0A7J3X6R3_THEPE